MALTLTLLALAFLMSVMVVPILQRRADQRRLLEGYDVEEPAPVRPPPVRELRLPPVVVPVARQILPPPPTAPAAPPPPPVLSLYQFLMAISDDCHVLLVGQSRSGKTTAANALTAQRSRTDRLVIFDPHYKPTNWCGLPALRKPAEMDQAMNTILAEFEQRKDRMAVGDESYEPITVFMDESPVLKDECPTYKRFIGKMLREALKYKIRLVVLTQSKQVRTMGIEGESDVLRNLAWVLLGDFAANVPGVDQVARPAALERGGTQVAINTEGLIEMGDWQARQDCVWIAPAPLTSPAPVADDSALLAALVSDSPFQNNPPPAASAAPPATQWTEEHVKVAAWLAVEPDIKNREIARRLWPEKSSGGDNAVKAGKLKTAVSLLVTFPAVSPVRVLAEHDHQPNATPAEDNEQLTANGNDLQPVMEQAA